MTEPTINHCQRDDTSEVTPRHQPAPVGSAPAVPEEEVHTADVMELIVRPPARVEPPEPAFEEVTRSQSAPDPATRGRWLGPVADTVLADFAFYGLLAGVPILFMWVFFGRWWIFRNADWIAIGLFFWFLAVVAWRRWRS